MKELHPGLRANKTSHILAFGIGCVGAIGQAWILFHILIDGYPFKMMGMPPYSFYDRVGNTGVIISPLVAIIVGWLFRNIRLYFVPAVPVLVCPLVFWLIFEISVFVTYTPDLLRQDNFEHYTGESAGYFFAYNVLTLLFWGALIGFIIGLVIQAVIKRFNPKTP